MDTRAPNDVIASWWNSLNSKLTSFNITKLSDDSFTITAADTKIVLSIIPMGLPEDNTIKSFSITRFMMEDYLVKILLSNPDEFYQDLNFKINNSNKLKTKVQEILSILRKQNISIASSKEIFTLMRVLVCDMPPHAFIHNIIEKTHDTILKDILKSIISRFSFLDNN